MRPVESMVAVAVLVEVQVTPLGITCVLLSEWTAVATYRSTLLRGNERVPGLTVIDDTVITDSVKTGDVLVG
jgi:hypothetical protein